jgi:dihydrodipicolinate synthase/N-acetylneuraminate lyase
MTARGPRGVWGTILLDVTPSGGIKYDAIAPQVAAIAEGGVDGIYCNGTATEFHGQTDRQMEEVAGHTVAAARAAGLPVQVGASHPLAQGALTRIRIASALRPDAIQMTLPDWTALDRNSVLRFLDGCAEAAEGIPLILYNPPQARTVLSPENLLAAAEKFPTLHGLKCGGGDAAWYQAMAPVLDVLSVFIPGHHYASGIGQGAHGAYSNIACLSPSGAVHWARLTKTDATAALEVEANIADFMAEAIAPMLAAGWPGFACDKAMAIAGGWRPLSQRLLWPHAAIPDDAVARISAAARRHLPEFLQSETLAP